MNVVAFGCNSDMKFIQAMGLNAPYQNSIHGDKLLGVMFIH
jgi:hypothetical protein